MTETRIASATATVSYGEANTTNLVYEDNKSLEVGKTYIIRANYPQNNEYKGATSTATLQVWYPSYYLNGDIEFKGLVSHSYDDNSMSLNDWWGNSASYTVTERYIDEEGKLSFGEKHNTGLRHPNVSSDWIVQLELEVVDEKNPYDGNLLQIRPFNGSGGVDVTRWYLKWDGTITNQKSVTLGNMFDNYFSVNYLYIASLGGTKYIWFDDIHTGNTIRISEDVPSTYSYFFAYQECVNVLSYKVFVGNVD